MDDRTLDIWMLESQVKAEKMYAEWLKDKLGKRGQNGEGRGPGDAEVEDAGVAEAGIAGLA